MEQAKDYSLKIITNKHPLGHLMEEFWYFIEKLNLDQKGKVFLRNYGQLILQDIMKGGLKLKQMPPTHLGPLFYQNND